jgi:hypothetical protein
MPVHRCKYSTGAGIPSLAIYTLVIVESQDSRQSGSWSFKPV